MWSLPTRIVFRFCCVYFSLYCVSTQIFFGLFGSLGAPTRWLFRLHEWVANVLPFVSWTAAHVFRAELPLVETGSGSGDKTFDWVQAFCFLALAAVAATVWSVVDRKRSDHVSLYKWFRLVIRFALASQLIAYGASKMIPMQMPFPFLTRLVEPYGNFSPMGVLWQSIGASPAYETFTGCAELLGGVLLIVPRTTTLGALISMADMTQVFVLNMTYDVPVKLLSFHLLLMSMFLLAPDLPRLANLFLLNRAAAPSNQPSLFRTLRANRIAVAAQILFGTWLVGLNVYIMSDQWKVFGGGRPKSPLYGIWNVEQFSVDGQIRPALLKDNERWRRAIFDFNDNISFQRMDDSFTRFGAKIDVNANTLALTKAADKNWHATFAFEHSAQDQLLLDGEMDARKIHLQLHLMDRGKFLLVSRGFHWIQEYPFNR
jgi:uncharacterized membrane protein YphA (DoxX/SURF4 family)